MRFRLPRRGPLLKGQPRPPIVSVALWLQKPDLFVTRRELWYLLEHYDKARLTAERENSWWRIALRRLLAPIFTPRTAPPTDLSSDPDHPVTRVPPAETGT